MAATTGTMQAVGLKTGQGYSIDLYFPDAVATQVTFDSGAGAGSTTESFYQFPEDVVITDISMAAAPTATRGRFVSNNVPSASVIRYGNHLYSLNNRPNPNIKVRAGSRLGIVQL